MQSHHASTFRHIPASSKPVSPERVAQVLADEWKLFTKNTAGSAAESERAFASLPLGVTSSFQHWDPYPISIASAEGAWMTDVDGRKLLDLSMGFGAMLAGHLNPIVVALLTEWAEKQFHTRKISPLHSIRTIQARTHKLKIS